MDLIPIICGANGWKSGGEVRRCSRSRGRQNERRL